MSMQTAFWLTTIVVGAIIVTVVHLMVEDSKRGDE